MISPKLTCVQAQLLRSKNSLAQKNLAYKVWVDFGKDIGILQTSAQITVHYTPETLVGRSVVGCVNLGEKNNRRFYFSIFIGWIL